MTRVLEDAMAASWALRRKPLESFMLPQAAVGDGMLACADGSLVSLVRIRGARSMTGAEELERFVELACRRLNGRLAAPGHALHLMLERAPDEAGPEVDRVCARAGNQAARLGLELRDVLDERARWLAPLLAAETTILACWTRPAALTVAEARRGRKRLRARLRAWLPEPGEAQCPLAVLDGLEPRHRALMDTVGALFGETGIVAERLDDEAALRTVRVLLNGADTTAPDWRPATAGNGSPARATEPPEAGAFPPPLAPQLLVRDPLRSGSFIGIGSRLYGALDMTLGPRESRPFAELMERLAEAKLPCRFSILIEGGGMRRLGAAAARVSSAFMAFSHPDSRAVRDAMRCLAEQDAGTQAVVRLRLGMLTWVGRDVSPGERGEELARRLGRLQQIAEGWGECVFSPLVGDPLEAFACTVPGFCCAGTAEPALAPLAEALRLLPVCRPAPMARTAVNHIFRAPDGRMLPFSCEEGEDHGFELIHGIPGRGKSVLMNSLTFAHLLQGGQARLPLSATIDIGPSSSGLISLVHEALPPERRAEAGWFPLRMSAACAINPCDTQLGCRFPLPAERAFLENLLGLILSPAGAAGGTREFSCTREFPCTRVVPCAGRHARADWPHHCPRLRAPLRSYRRRGAQHVCPRPRRARGRGAGARRARSFGRALVGGGGLAVRCGRRGRGVARAALRGAGAGRLSRRRARACGAGTGGRCGPRDRRGDRDPGLHPHPHRAGGLLARHVRAHRLRHRRRQGGGHRPQRGGAKGLGRGRPPDRRLLHAGPPCAHPPLVDRGRRPRSGAGALPRMASRAPAGDTRDLRSAWPSTSSTAPVRLRRCARRWSATPARRASTACASASPPSVTTTSGRPWWSSPTASGCWGRAARHRSRRRCPGCLR